jgi:hypothetical protein
MKNPKSEIRNPKQIRSPKSGIAPGAPVCNGLYDSPAEIVLSSAWDGGHPTDPVRPLSRPSDTLSPAPSGGEGRGEGARGLVVNVGDFSVSRSKVRAPLRLLLCLLIVHSALCLCASAQSYAIDWHTIDGGGGTSTGAVYSVSGTVGQPDAGTMSGGNYTLHGGFWGILAAVQTPGAPLLSVFRTTTNTVAVTWPSPSMGWTLQQNTNSVAGINWSNVTGGIVDDGTTKTLIANPSVGNRFYRLIKP